MLAESHTSPRVVLVTGAARRVGAEIARTLHQRGLNVAIHYRGSQQEAEQLAAQLNAHRPDSCACFAADLLEVAQLPALVERVVARFGRLDMLVNNASSFYATPLGQCDEAAWHELVGANLKAPLFLSQAAAPWLIRLGGAIVNIVDIHAERPMPGHLIYSLAKAGLVALTKGLAGELAPAVRVNAVAPGVNLWPEHHDGFDEQAREQILAHTFLRRSGQPADLAGAVAFLLLDAPYVTGHVLNVDGGRSVYI